MINLAIVLKRRSAEIAGNVGRWREVKRRGRAVSAWHWNVLEYGVEEVQLEHKAQHSLTQDLNLGTSWSCSFFFPSLRKFRFYTDGFDQMQLN